MEEVKIVYKEWIGVLNGLHGSREAKLTVHMAGGSWQPARYIRLGYDKNNKGICYIKMPKFKNYKNQVNGDKNDEMTFIINSLLGFNVIPITMVVGHHLDIIHRLPANVKRMICDDSFRDNYKTIIVQQVVSLSDNQCHLTDDFNPSSLDNESVQQAILLNIIVGRGDSGPQNSVIDNNNRIVDVDNECIGYSRTGYWLIPHCKDMVISNHLLERVRNNKDKVKLYLSHRQDSLADNIRSNLSRLLSFQQDNIKVSDLMDLFYQETRMAIECQQQ